MIVKITGYKFEEKELATGTRGELAIEKSLPRKKEDVTLYWQNYREASLDKPVFWYMVADRSMDKVLGKPSTFSVAVPGEE